VKVIKEIQELLAKADREAPRVAEIIRSTLVSLETLPVASEQLDLYSYGKNDPVNAVDMLGLMWWWPPDWFNKKPKCPDCAAEKELLDELITKLIEELSKIADPKAKLFIQILLKAKETQGQCSGMIDAVEPCGKWLESRKKGGAGDVEQCILCCLGFNLTQGASESCKIICTYISPD
jgi:hypothetical protein